MMNGFRGSTLVVWFFAAVIMVLHYPFVAAFVVLAEAVFRNEEPRGGERIQACEVYFFVVSILLYFTRTYVLYLKVATPSPTPCLDIVEEVIVGLHFNVQAMSLIVFPEVRNVLIFLPLPTNNSRRELRFCLVFLVRVMLTASFLLLGIRGLLEEPTILLALFALIIRIARIELLSMESFSSNSSRTNEVLSKQCKRCRYHGNNSYLTCAVNPCKTVDDQNGGCQHYQPIK